MNIKMLSTRRGSEDGFSIRLFEKGKTYQNVGLSLARYFIHHGFAEEAKEGA